MKPTHRLVTPDLTAAEQQILGELARDNDHNDTVITIDDDTLQAVGRLIDTSDIQKRGWEDRYLAALYITGSETDAAEFANIGAGWVRRRIREDAVFAELHQQALSNIYAKLRDAAISRALHGVPETYTNKRGETITRRRYDNRLLIEVIDRFLPEMRRDAAQDALEHGIHVTFHIGDLPQPKQLPAGDVEADSEELPEADAA